MNVLNITFVIVVLVGLLLFMYGYQKKSQLLMCLGGIVFLAPLFYFLGWATFLPFVPPIALVISDLMKRKVNHI